MNNISNKKTGLEARLLTLYHSVAHNPGKWLLGWLAIYIALGTISGNVTSGFTDLPYNNNPRVFFKDTNQEYKDFRIMEDTYSQDNGLIFLIEGKDGGDVFNRETLEIVQHITEQGWTFPESLRVDSITNFQHTTVEGDELYTDYLVQDIDSLTDEDLEDIRSIALKEKALVSRLVSPDGRIAAVLIRVLLGDTQEEAKFIVQAAEEMEAELHKLYPNTRLMMTGDVAFADATEQATNRSMEETTPLSMLMVVICLAVLLRSLVSTAVVMCMVGLSIAIAFMTVLIIGIELSPVVALGLPMILTLAVADCVHILVTYQQQGGLGKSKQEAMIESLRINFQPVWLTSITTCIGFLLMNFADAQPFNALGTLVAIGVLWAWLLSVTLLPALMMLVPQVSFDQKHSNARTMQRLSEFVISHTGKLITVTSIFIISCIAALPTNTINDVFNEYFDETFEVRRVLDFYLENLGGVQRVQFNVPSGEESGVTKPEYLRNLDKFENWLMARGDIDHVNSFNDVVKRLNRNMHGGDEAFYTVPDDRELIAQYILLYELGLPQGLGLDNQVSFDKSHTKMEAVLKHVSSADLVHLKDQADAWIKENWPDYMQTKGSGLDVLFGKVTFWNVRSMLLGTALALVTVSLLLIFALRSWRYGALSLLPNLLPALVSFGIWGLYSGNIGIAVSIVACMTLGIVVDDTVHFLSKYVRAKRENGLGTEDAVRYAFRTVGIALIGTSVVLVANFAVMATDHFYLNSSMGALTAITLVVALVIDFFFFVPLLLLMDRRRQSRSSPAS